MSAERLLMSRPFKADDLAVVREELRQNAVAAGIDGDALSDFVTAVFEVLVNAVRHGGGSGLVQLRVEGHLLVADVSDSGAGLPGLPPARKPEPDSADGRGLWLARCLADGLGVSAGPDSFTVSVWRSLRGRPSL